MVRFCTSFPAQYSGYKVVTSQVAELKNKIVKPHYQSFVLSNFDIDKLLGIITIVLYWFD